MLVVLRTAGHESDHDVSHEALATVADLLAAFDQSVAPGRVLIDSRAVDCHDELAAIPLRHGSLVELDPPTHSDGGLWLEATGGPAAGSRTPIGRGGIRVGRSGQADLTLDDPRLAPLHFSMRRLTDAAVELTELGAEAATTRSGDRFRAGDSAFRVGNSSNHAEEPAQPPQLRAPQPPPAPADPQPLPWLSIMAPAALGVGLALLIHPMMLLMGFMSPVMLLAGWGERRRQLRRQRRDRASAWQQDLDAFGAQVAQVRAGIVLWERAMHPDPVSLLHGAHLPPTGSGPAIGVATGLTGRPWEPQFDRVDPPHPDVQGIVSAAGPLPDVPLLTELRYGDRVAVVGPRPQAEALCRWLIIQVALARHSSELSLRLDGELSPGWAWTARLPHFNSAAPDAITFGVDTSEPTVSFDYGNQRHTDGLPVEVAAELARRITHAHAAETAANLGGAGLSLTSTCADIGTTPSSIIDSWQRHRADRLHSVLGIGPEGPALVDLVAAGPHALIAGTTGSGKSELLRALVLTTSISASPQHVNFVLIDYKGGSAFDACAGLPHVVGIVTDLDGDLAERALRCLGSEIRRREGVLRGAGVSDLSELPPGELPRLCLVIDELAGLVADLPRFTEGLIGVAQRGRSLGIHLIMATQRPSGAVTPAIRANTSLRICLRVPDPIDSEDVIDSALAARIPGSQPGRGWVRSGPDELSPLQAVDTSAPLTASRPVFSRPWGTSPIAVSPTPDESSGLGVLVDATQTAWRTIGGTEPVPPWPDPLPDSITLENLPSASAGVAIGLVDDPDEQRVGCLSWDRRRGHLVIAGGPRSGRTTGLLSAASACASSAGTRLVGIDAGGGALAPLASLSGCGGVYDLTDLDRTAGLLEGLVAQAHGRSGQGCRTVLVIDRLGTLLAALESCRDYSFMAALTRLWADGPSREISCVVSVDRPGDVPNAMAAATAETLLLKLSNSFDYLPGLNMGNADDAKPGRGHESSSGRVIQIAQAPCSRQPSGASSCP